MKQDNEELTIQLASDPDRYFKQLVLQYQHRLYSFMLRQTGSPEDAEDIAQETFLRAYYALKDYADQQVQVRKIQSWLYKIALNVFYNRVRATKFHIISLDTAEQCALVDIEHQAPGPEEEVWQHERRYEIEAAITTLPETYSVVLNLYYFEELKYQEIADLLNQPLGTIKSKISRGIGLLRSTLSSLQQDQVG
jgi:RNA polymerase sigma-70 factor, ECF subfamily